MSSLVKVENGMTFVTSKDLADSFGKENKNVMRDIRKIELSNPNFAGLNFEPSTYISKQNKELECYKITRDGFAILAMGFTGKKATEWKIKYINAFNAMETELRSQANGKSVIQKVNAITAILEADKKVVSESARNMNEWKRIKKDHESNIKKLVTDAQLTLGFNF